MGYVSLELLHKDNMTTSDSSRITNKQVMEAIQSLIVKVEVMTIKLDNEIVKTDKLTSDHENRIRNLEKLVWTSSWVSSAVSTVITALIVAYLTGKI